MIHLEFPPQYVHVAFSPVIVRQRVILRPGQDQSEIHQEDNFDRDPSRESERQDSEHLTEGIDGGDIQNFYESMFAVMGEYGNSVMIYSSDSVILRHHIQVGTVVRLFQFSKNG